MKKATVTTAVELVPHWEPPSEPSWAKAREYADKVRESCIAIIHLGVELHALRAKYFDCGHGQRNDLKQLPPQGCGGSLQGTHPAELRRGWQAKVREELGISDDTARRIMDRARYVGMIKALAEGDDVEYTDSKKQVREVQANEERKQLASAALDEIVAGTASPQRAWAGVVGETTRREKGGTPERAPVDHYKNIKGGLTALKTSLRKWKTLEPGQRAELEVLWSEVRKALPETWTE